MGRVRPRPGLVILLLLLSGHACAGASAPAPATTRSPALPAPSLQSSPSPRPAQAYKGLTDNPAYQWWRDPTGPQPDSWWGLGQTEQSLERQASIMQDLGARLFRVELPWSFVAPDRPGGATYDSVTARNPGWPGYRWQRWDSIVKVAGDHGLQLVPEVYFAPSWATGVAATTAGGPNAPPTSPQYYADFVHALVERYHDRIHYWELGNEPDYAPHSWSAGLKAYVDLMLRPGYQAVKEVDPTAQVLMGGLASDTAMSAFYAAGAKGSFDIANFHAYYIAAEGDATALDHVLAAMRTNGDADKPIWLTEFGLPTHDPTGPKGPADPLSDTAEIKQAALIRGVYAGLGTHLQAILFYQLRDTAVYGTGGRLEKQVYWGLLNRDLSRRKLGYDAFAAAPSGDPPPLGSNLQRHRPVGPFA